MTSIKDIIGKQRSIIEAAGFLKRPETNISARTRLLRPSLGKVSAALAEDPSRFARIEESPFLTLFNYTLPKMAPLLVELEPARAEAVVSLLCAYGKLLIKSYGPECTANLELTYRQLADFETILNNAKSPSDCLHAVLGFNLKSGCIYDGAASFTLRDAGNSTIVLLVALLKLMKLDDLTMEMKLRFCSGITDASLAYISSLPNIRKLDLDGTRVTEAGLAAALTPQHLESLTLRSYLDAASLELPPLAGFTNLKELNLSGAKFSDADLALLPSFPKLTRLNLSGTGITDRGLSYLSRLPVLQELGLYKTQITDNGLAGLKSLTGLRSLNLGATQITNAGLIHLKAFHRLESLALSCTMVTNRGLSGLFDLPTVFDRLFPNKTASEPTTLFPDLKLLEAMCCGIRKSIKHKLKTSRPELFVQI